MAARANTVAQAFSARLMIEMYDKALMDEIANRDYEGEIDRAGSKVNILNFDRVSEKTYSGANLTVDDLTENNATLTIDQYKSFYWKEKTLDNWLSYIKNPHPTVVTQTAEERRKNIDTFLFGLYGDVGAGHRVGTDYTTGTVAVAATTGVVTGTSTVFTSAMVGKGFKATGHTTWYRVKTFTSTTSITIEDDKDDVTSAYTGGTIAGGATYTLEAATVLTITAANLLQYVGAMKLKLDLAEKSGYSSVPDSERWFVAPPEFFDLLIRATGVALHVPAAYEELIKRGFMTELLSFKMFKSNRLTGNNTDGYHVLAGHPSWVTFAEKVLQASIEEDLVGNFGMAYKDLFVYGAKIVDSRRHMAAEGFWKF